MMCKTLESNKSLRILLEQRADLAVVSCEYGNGIVRLVPCLVIVGMNMRCHGKFSLCIEVKRPASHPAPPGAALLSLYMLYAERLSGNKAFITEHFRSYAEQG